MVFIELIEKKCYIALFLCYNNKPKGMVRWYMKTLQQIEKEYETYCGKTDVVKSLDDFLSFIEIGIDDTEEYQKDYEKELKENNRWKLYEKIQNFFFYFSILLNFIFYLFYLC